MRPARRSRSAPDRRTLRASWLSLFAMLMIFIGPLVSQSMPMDHRAMPMPDMHHGMAMEGMAGCHDTGQPSDPTLHVMWEKCGYCSLFFHCPALPQPPSLLTDDALPAPRALSVQPRQGHARQAVFPGARSRAPPASFIV